MNAEFRPVDYARPSQVDDAVRLLAEGSGWSRLIAGGTDLLVQKPVEVRRLVDTGGLGLINLTEHDGRLRIESGMTVSDIESAPLIRDHPCWRLLAEAAASLGTPGVRNRATIGGNLCNGSPAADLAVAALALDGRAEIAGRAGVREVGLDDFFIGVNHTAVKEDEVLVAVDMPGWGAASGFTGTGTAAVGADVGTSGVPGGSEARESVQGASGVAGAFLKLRRHQSSVDIATVNTAAVVRMREGVIAEARVAVGAVAEIPFVSKGAAAALAGREPSDEAFRAAGAAAAAEARPISDIRASAEYRREMIAVLVRRVLEEAVRRCGA